MPSFISNLPYSNLYYLLVFVRSFHTRSVLNIFIDVTGNTEHFIVYERVRVAQVLADLREHHTENIGSWDSLTQDVPYQRGTH